MNLMDKIKICLNEMKDTLYDHPILGGLAALGTLMISFKVLKTMRGVWRYVLRPSKNLSKVYGEKGAWAIVTGGSSGIGLAYAKALAKVGFNLLLIARNTTKLEEKRKEILDESGKNPPEIQTLSFDFSKPYSQEYYNQLEEVMRDKSIAILVNNVGLDYTCGFCDLPTKKLVEMMNVNICALTYLTKMVIPIMEKRKKRSAIIGISSTFTKTGMSQPAFYITTKAYMDNLLRCLYHELKEKNIDVLNCLTGEVSTPSNPLKSIWHATAESVAKGHLSALGHDEETAGIIRHAFYKIFLKSCLSFSFKRWLIKTSREHTINSFQK